MSTENVQNHHPLYDEILPDWVIARDCVKGQRQIKSKRETYLSATSGMRKRGMSAGQEGLKQYEAYLLRSVFPDLCRPAINALVGTMHREEADIQLPEGMEDVRLNATLEGEGLQTLLRRINEAQLITGRVGLLVDVPDGSEGIPYITVYEAEKIINWDESRRKDGRLKPDLVVLDESASERTSEFGWEYVQKHLVLDLVQAANANEIIGSNTPVPPQQGAVYRSRLMVSSEINRQNEGVNRQTEVTAQGAGSVQGVIPQIRGTTLEEIPFIFLGSVDLSADPDQVPILGLANLSLAIYRGEADYRHTLFMQGQDTLVIIGDIGDETTGKSRIIGANNSLDLPMGADAKYIGVSSQGLGEQRQSLENDRNRASELGANLLSSSKGGGKEAEETLRIRVAARTASILTVIKAGAEGLENALKFMARWRGLDETEVVVTPNTDFIGDQFAPKDLVDLMTAKTLGAPLSRESVHRWMSEKDVTNFDLDEELEKIESEEPIKGQPDPEAEAAAKAEDREFQLAMLNAGGQGPGPGPGPGQGQEQRVKGQGTGEPDPDEDPPQGRQGGRRRRGR